jgi:hypothetical protein
MPPVLRDVVLDFLWDPKLLWSLDLPVTQVPMEELDWHLQLPMWAFEETPFVVTPVQVAQNPEAFTEQYARTLAADLSFPLHVLQRPNRLTVLDGMHRLLRAHLEGRRRVQVKMLPIDRLDDIAHTKGPRRFHPLTQR